MQPAAQRRFDDDCAQENRFEAPYRGHLIRTDKEDRQKRPSDIKQQHNSPRPIKQRNQPECDRIARKSVTHVDDGYVHGPVEPAVHRNEPCQMKLAINRTQLVPAKEAPRTTGFIAGYKLGERQTGAYGASSVDPGSQPLRHVARYEIERYRIGKKWLERDVNVSEECEDLVGRSSTLIDDNVRDSLERLHPSEIGKRRAQRRRFSLAPGIDGEANAGCCDDCGRLSTPTHLLLV